jgi:Secretion system C-terminal sorting domain
MYWKKTSFLLILLCFCKLTLHAQWSKINFEGGISNTIVQTDSFFFMINFQGIYRSDKKKIVWQKLNTIQLEKDITFRSNTVGLLSESNKLYFISNNNSSFLFESDDNGNSWENITPNKLHRMSNIYTLNNKQLLIAVSKLNQSQDTTYVYERVQKHWEVKAIHEGLLNVQYDNDTIYLQKTVGQNSVWYTSVDGLNLNLISNNPIWNSFRTVKRKYHKFYVVDYTNNILTSNDGINFTAIGKIPDSYFFQSISIFDATIYLNLSKAFTNFIYSSSINQVSFIKSLIPNTLFNTIIKSDSSTLFSTYSGVYRLKNNKLSYEMNGLNEPYINKMYTLDSILFIETRDTIFRSLDKGKHWQVMDYFRPQENSLIFHRWHNKVIVDNNGKIFESLDAGINFTPWVLPDTNITYSEILGYDKSAIYLNAMKNANQVYYRTTDGLNFKELSFIIFGIPFHPSFIYEDNDTVFAFGSTAHTQYYSIDNGMNWNGYNYLTNIGVPYALVSFGTHFKRPYVYCVDISTNNRDDIALIRYNNKWNIVPMFPDYISIPAIYINNTIAYVFRDNNVLQYSLDSFKTMQNYTINLTVQIGFPNKNLAMIGQTVFLDVAHAGLWHREIETPTTGLNDVVNQHNLKLFPNPASQSIHILLDTEIGQIDKFEVYNSLGQLVGQSNHLNVYQTQESIEVDVSQYTEGLYHLVLYNGKGKYASRFIVKK